MVSLRVRWLFLSTLGLGAVLAGPAQADNLQSGAPIALVEDFDSGAVLYEKSADEPMAPAAMTQLMTADVVFDQLRQSRIHLDDRFAVSEYAWRTGGGPSRGPAMFLDVHSEARVEDLIRGLAIQSGNDAAITLAEGVSGSSGAFAELMNKRAGELGLAHSHFVNSFGKSDPAQKVTARDMAALAADIIRNFPDGYRYFSEKDFTWNKIHQLNRNPLLVTDLGADGLKASDSAEGGFGLVGSGMENGQRLIVVLNGLKSATERQDEARKLFTWGFRSFDARVLFQPGDTVGEAAVYGGVSSVAPLTVEAPAKVFIPHGSTDRLLAKVVYSGPLIAPVAEGFEVGRLKIWRGATLALDVPVKTKVSVARGGLAKRALDALLEMAQGGVRKALSRS